MGMKQKKPAKKLPGNIRKRWKAGAAKEAEEDSKWDDLEIEELLEDDTPKKAKPSKMYRSALLTQVKQGGIDKKEVAKIVTVADLVKLSKPVASKKKTGSQKLK
ncbi:UNVERIFIED_CONTAM: hypothetical protein HDU68_010507 [Siphonaria sp. JEL0065]|nr:hypothetical protein HDU68_010507 [Siphonaria sp. JEL0065]